MDRENFFAGLDEDFCPQFQFGVLDDLDDEAFAEIEEAPQPTVSTTSSLTSATLDDEIRQFVINSKAKSTQYKETSGARRIKLFIAENYPNEKREFWELPKNELDAMICLFFMRAEKIDQKAIDENGKLYQPDTLNSFRNSWQRILMDKKIGYGLSRRQAEEKNSQN